MPDTFDVPSEVEVIKKRKKEGIDIPLQQNVQAKTTSTYLEYVRLVHDALPEMDYEDIDTSMTFLRKRFSAPIIIDSMTGGTDEATVINGRLGELAEKYGFGMGLGSQRAGLKSEEAGCHLFDSKKECAKCILNSKHRWGTTFQGVHGR